jgi:hypothetical protein
LHTKSQYHPTLNPFNASIYLPGSDLALYSFQTPTTVAVDGVFEHVLQRVSIANQDEFLKFSTQLFLNETLTVWLKGQGTLKEGGLPTTSVNWDQEIYINGES